MSVPYFAPSPLMGGTAHAVQRIEQDLGASTPVLDRFDRPRPTQAPHEDLPTLFDHGLTPRIEPTPTTDSIADAFAAFHAANPWVYDALVRLARDLVERGASRVGIGMLYEVLRWQWTRSTSDPVSDFKLNNNYRSRYARLIMEQETDLAAIFHTRTLTSEDPR